MDQSVSETGESFVGVRRTEDGSLDFDSALKVFPNEPDDKKVKETRFQKAIQTSEEVGLSEEELRILTQTLSMNDSPIQRRAILSSRSKELGISTEEVLSLARNYQKEKMRLTENGELYHYHQTSFNVLESAADMGCLMSYNRLKELGKEPSSSGSRPDVVQMTRDKYDGEGNLRDKGLVDGLSIGAAGLEVALVFDPSIIDLPDYDCIGKYPNLPTIPLDKLNAVLVRNQDDAVRAKGIVDKYNLNAEVKTREEWNSTFQEGKK